MKRTVAALALASAALAGCQSDPTGLRPTAPSLDARDVVPSAGSVPGQYVVLFRRERVNARAAALAAAPASGGSTAAAVTALAGEKIARAPGATLRHTFTHAVHGFAARLSDSAAAALRADPDVALVEPDPVVRANGGVETAPPWGLDRIDQAQLPLDGSYRYGSDGSGVSVYIIDTGINFTHVEFGGRAVTGVDYVTAGGAATDCAGHGTHVAGTVGGATYGVAKNARLVAMRVLDCSGSGSGSNVIAALDWVAGQKQANASTPMVANMSLGGDAAAVIDSAVTRTVAAGVTVVVAAGNSGADACNSSPARTPAAITVAATDSTDTFASFSNSGSCVDIAAPGVRVLSAYVGGTTAAARMSGTSMATPHVAGAAALFLSVNPTATPAQVVAALTTNASSGPIIGLPPNTPARLLDVAFLNAGTSAPSGPTTGVLSNGATGTCLAIPGNSASSTVLGVAPCATDAAGQQWTVSATGVAGAIAAFSGSRCVDDYGANGRAGDAVGTWVCNGQANQRWTLTATGALQGTSGLCAAAPTAAGTTAVTLQPCDGTPAQTWTRGAAASPPSTPTRFTAMITNTASGLCVDVAGGATDAGGRAITWTCNGQRNQRWSMPPNGTAGAVTVYDGALCLDAFGGGGRVGDVIGTWTCNGQANQSWTLTSTGALQGANGYCLAASASGSAGDGLTLQACDGSAVQQWSATPTASGTAVASRGAVPRVGTLAVRTR